MHRPRETRTARRLTLLTGLGIASLLVGCHGSLSDLDREVARMIDQRQRLALGEQGVSDASVAKPRPIDRNGLYREQPDTYNPAAGDLPARQADDDPATDSTDKPAAPLDAMQLDLQALLAYAIEHAPEYRAEKEALFLTTLSLIIERHAWGPRFFNSLSSDIVGTPESGDYDTALQIVNDFTVTQRLPYGGDVSVSALVNYTSLLHRASTTTSGTDTQDARINASIDLPLLRGSGQVAREDLIQAERDVIYAARDFERFRREFFVDISSTYFSLLRQQNRVENQQEQVKGLQRLADEQRARVNAERLAGFEAADAEAQLLFAKSDLASVADDYASALDSLKLRIGMPVERPLAIVPVRIDVPQPALDVAESIQIGQTTRLDLQTRGDRISDARRRVLIAKDRLRGDLDLGASANLRTDSGRDVGGADFDLGDSDYRVGLEYSPPLDRKIELAGYRSSLIDLERTEREYRVQRDRVALDIRDAIRTIERATLTLQLQTENVRLAELRVENLQLTSQKLDVIIPPRRIIEAEQDLLEARNRRDQSRADLQTSILNYLLQTGQMRVDGQGRWLAPGTLAPAEDAPGPDPPIGDQEIP